MQEQNEENLVEAEACEAKHECMSRYNTNLNSRTQHILANIF
jgi:hypothetical protein